MKTLLPVLAGLVALTITGCSQGQDDSKSEQGREVPSTFDSTAALITAMSEAGRPCQDVGQDGLVASCAGKLFFAVNVPTADYCERYADRMDSFGRALRPSANKYNYMSVDERKDEYLRFVGWPMIVGQNWWMYGDYFWSAGLDEPQMPWPADFDAASMAEALGGNQTTLGQVCGFPATLEEAQR